MATRRDARVWLALVTVYIVWGSTFIALAIVVRDLPPYLAMATRHLVAGAALLAVALPRGDRAGDPIGRRQVGAGFVFGGLLFLLGHGSLAWAQQTVPAGVAALLVGSIPIWMALARPNRVRPPPAHVRVRRVRARVRRARVPLRPVRRGLGRPLGALVIVLSALCWAAGSLYSRGAPLPKRPLVSAGLASVCGGVLLLVTAIAIGELGDVRITLDALLALGYLVVIGTFVGFTAYVWLLRVAPISLVATYAYVNPIVAVCLGWALLGEEITVQMAAAGSLVVIAVALIVRASGTALEPGRGCCGGRGRRPASLPRVTVTSG